MTSGQRTLRQIILKTLRQITLKATGRVSTPSRSIHNLECIMACGLWASAILPPFRSGGGGTVLDSLPKIVIPLSARHYGLLAGGGAA